MKYYKKWTGLAASAETSVFFRSREHQGHGLKNLEDCNEKQQIVKWMIMKESKDPQARRIFERRLERDKRGEIGRGKKDSICLKIEKLESVLNFEGMRGEIRKAGSKEGLKTTRRVSHRAKVLKVYKREKEEKRIVPLHDYQMQANWLQWSDKLNRGMEQSVEWGKIMTCYSERLLKFILNANLNTLPSPDNLKRWNVKKGKDFKCGLCPQSAATAAHILAGCPYVLRQENQKSGVVDRYTWRHNSVLSVIKKHVVKRIREQNVVKEKRSVSSLSSGMIDFVKAGYKFFKSQKKKDNRPLAILEKATDWECDFDLPQQGKKKYQMDQRVCATSFKPDGYIVSQEQKICVALELTCPMEENMEKRHLQKKKKYEQELTSAVYQMHYVIVEVGARGGLPDTLRRDLRRLGLTKKEAGVVVEECVIMARRCSFVIWCQRFNPDFVATEMQI